jgi:hypothetical protein
MTTELQEIQETEEIVNEQEETVEIQEIQVEDTVEQEVPEVPTVLRTRRHGVWEVYDGAWGSYLRPIDDPDANVVISEDNLKVFNLKPDIHKIPPELWSRWVKLCFYYVDKVTSSVEVSIRILRSEEDPSQYRFLVPRQKVSGASVRVDSFDEAIDIETGEEITQYPPSGWIPVGSSHSHNTMPSFFSGIDDRYELGDPGIHLVVGGIKVSDNRYTIAASVVGGGRRFEVEYDNLIDATPVSGVNFHPKVIDYVDYTSPLALSSSAYTSKYTSVNRSAGAYDDLSNYQNWLMKSYGGYDESDPYSYNDGTSSYGKSRPQSKALAIWEMEELIDEFIEENKLNFSKLVIFADALKDKINDIESAVSQNF